MSWQWPEEINHLAADGIRLVPLTLDHIPGLVKAASSATDNEHEMGFVPRPEDIVVYVNRALAEKRAGRSFPFAVCLPDGEPIGTSWFRVFDTWRKKLEIGFTWYASPHRKGIANLRTKMLLMTFAFERLGCILVEFLVHIENGPSQRAVEGLGVRKDGTLRRVIPMKDGSFGDVFLYSVADDEWPAVKAVIAERLEQRKLQAS